MRINKSKCISDIKWKVYMYVIRKFGGSGLYLYSCICLSAGVVEWQPYCFVIILLHHAPPKVASVLVLFVIFEGLLLVFLLHWWPILWLFILLCSIEGIINELAVVDRTLELTFQSSFDLLSVTELAFLDS